MEVREFFLKAKTICENNFEKECPNCPLNEFCCDGIFAMDSEEVEKVIEIVENVELLN